MNEETYPDLCPGVKLGWLCCVEVVEAGDWRGCGRLLDGFVRRSILWNTFVERKKRLTEAAG